VLVTEEVSFANVAEHIFVDCVFVRANYFVNFLYKSAADDAVHMCFCVYS